MERAQSSEPLSPARESGSGWESITGTEPPSSTGLPGHNGDAVLQVMATAGPVPVPDGSAFTDFDIESRLNGFSPRAVAGAFTDLDIDSRPTARNSFSTHGPSYSKDDLDKAPLLAAGGKLSPAPSPNAHRQSQPLRPRPDDKGGGGGGGGGWAFHRRRIGPGVEPEAGRGYKMARDDSLSKKLNRAGLKEIKTHRESKPARPRSEFADVVTLALPALGSVLADPLMSLVDTACVGQTSSLELAALGPNTAIFNFVFQIFAFLGVCTTNILATNSLAAPGISAEERGRRFAVAQRMLAYALTAAALLGVGVVICMQAIGPSILTLVGSNAEMLAPGLEYLRIRAIASPAVMVMSVAQGACLGQQDAWTPLQVFAAAGVFNLIGDVYLILRLRLGISGAAVATTVAQYLGAAFFLWYMRRQGLKDNGTPLVWHGLPTIAALRPFAGVAWTLLSRTMFTMVAFTALTTAATRLGTVATAAHQVALQIFWLLTFLPEPLSMTAQSLIARDSTDPAKVRRMAHLLLRLGFFVGALEALILAVTFLALPRLFTNDAAVVALIRPLTLQGALAIGLCCFTLLCDGVAIGSGDFRHLPRTNFIAMAGCATMLVAGARAGHALPTVWWSLVLFYALRLGQHGLHHWLHWHASAFGLYQRLPAGDPTA